MNSADKHTSGANPIENYSVFKFNVVGTVIAVLASALIGWGVSLIPDTGQTQLVAGLCAGAIAAVFLVTSANASGSRASIVIRTLAWTSLVLSIIISLCMAAWCENYRYFILVNGALLLAFAGITYGVAKSGQ